MYLCQSNVWITLKSPLYSFFLYQAERHELLPLDRETASSLPSVLFVWDNPRPLHSSLGLHPWELETGLPDQHQCILWTGPHRSSNHLKTHQLPASAQRRKPPDVTATRPLPPPQAPPGLRQTHDALLDDGRSAWPWTLCWLPLQCYCGELGTQEACMGDADGELSDGSRCAVEGNARARFVHGAGGRASREADRCCGEGGGTVSSPEWTELLTGQWAGNQTERPVCVFWQVCMGDPVVKKKVLLWIKWLWMSTDRPDREEMR